MTLIECINRSKNDKDFEFRAKDWNNKKQSVKADTFGRLRYTHGAKELFPICVTQFFDDRYEEYKKQEPRYFDVEEALIYLNEGKKIGFRNRSLSGEYTYIFMEQDDGTLHCKSGAMFALSFKNTRKKDYYIYTD